MKQSENYVVIEGILSENKLERGSYAKNGSQVNCIRGSIVVRTEQKMGDELRTLEIPVYVFTNQYTNAGKVNPAYTSLETVMDTYKSIAAVGIDEADRVRITARDSIRMNEYFNNNQQLVSYPRINATFINKVDPSRYHPQATFSTTMLIKSMAPEMDSEGVETGRIKLECCLVGWGDRVDVVPFYSLNENVTSAIESQWEVGDTVRATGYINFTSTTKEDTVEQAFGDPIIRQRTVTVSELLINGGSEPLGGDLGYSIDEMRAGLEERAQRLEMLKNRAQVGGVVKTAPAKENKNLFSDLGF